GGTMLSRRVFGRGENHRIPLRILIDGQRNRAAAKAPRRKRPCRSRALSVDPSRSWLRYAQPIFAGGPITREIREGEIAWFAQYGGAQDGLSSAKRAAVTPPCGAHRISWRRRAAPLCPRSAAASPAALRRACSSSLPGRAPRARPARCGARPP